MDNESMDSLFEDALDGAPAEDTAAAAQETPAGDDGQQESKDTAKAENPQKPVQDEQERSRQAEGRRRYEAEQRGYKQARQDLSALIQELGIENSDGNVIGNIEELEKLAKERRQQRWDEGRPTEADVRRAAREELQSSRQPAAPEPPADSITSEQRAEIDRQLAAIRQMDPEMTDLNAILQSEAGQKFRRYVDTGLDFVDAYKLAAEERLSGIRANRQGAKTGGKDHLTSTSQRGSGDIDVPPDEMALFRELNPDMSEADIRRFYTDYKKNG